jgi:hypothetical protein
VVREDGRISNFKAQRWRRVGAVQFTVVAVILRVLYGRRVMGDHFARSAPVDWSGVGAAAVGAAGAVAAGWAVHGPGWLPWWAALAVAFAAGEACERFAGWWGSRA